MIYVIRGYRLCARKACIKGETRLVMRWVHKSFLDMRCATLKEARDVISIYIRIDRRECMIGRYKYTIQCIKENKNGKR